MPRKKLTVKSILLCHFYLFLSLVLLQPAFASQNTEINLSKLGGTVLLEADYQRTQVNMELAKLPENRWRPFQQADILQGITNQAHWLRFTATNPTDQAIHWVIRGETSFLDYLEIYYRNDSGTFQHETYSDWHDFQQRQINYRTLSAGLSTPAHTKTEVILKAYFIGNDTMNLRFSLYTSDDFNRLSQRENLLYGLFYGAMLLLVLLSLMAAAILRQIKALFYAAFLISSILCWLMVNGLGFQYLWPHSPEWHNQGFHIAYLIFGFTALQFGRSFLFLSQTLPKVNRLFIAIQLLYSLILIAYLFGYLENVILYISHSALATTALLMPVVGFIAWRKRISYAVWFMAAWLIYSTGLILTLMSTTIANLNWGNSPLDWLQMATLLESIFLMVAVSSWIIELNSEHKKAITLAHQDPLTELGNRRLLQSRYTDYYNNLNDRSLPLFMLVIDLDSFKEINDNYGHDGGDVVLKELGCLIKQNCGAEDVAIRFGGEEFAILVALNSIEEAWELAERIRLQFANNPTYYCNQQIKHTLSCGIAEVLSKDVQLNVNEIMRCADSALYKAKQAGRNQTHLCESPVGKS
ncbi:sensor domain-containing diguanylate cyclase [Thiomicrorhabdus sediminis]|uniref:diguanylate cyclase n=1 Tax=Thiomicrorhabdus sediminis TaxID=2580412 RepID=A0A4P9K4F4_9GAMM|nr:diguanylate cyclase [Thiomicrorhabdus sediminis]QCU89812.1 GGDEF domain-containing protein [Thiomicrorhabdus sediminis]